MAAAVAARPAAVSPGCWRSATTPSVVLIGAAAASGQRNASPNSAFVALPAVSSRRVSYCSPTLGHSVAAFAWLRQTDASRLKAAFLAGAALAVRRRCAVGGDATRGSARSAVSSIRTAAGGAGVDLEAPAAEALNFVEDIVALDLKQGTHGGRVCTRFPPEPNGFLHIGHAKSICLNFGIAKKFGGSCNLRFDDTNPASEKQIYIDSIKKDVEWLGFEWDGPEKYASDYFPTLHGWAIGFIEKGWAYVDELSAEDMNEYRGTLTSPGKDSPYRNRSVEENLELFQRMSNRQMPPGSAVLRAKTDMAHRNVIMRDPVMYRIVLDPPHPRTKDEWPVYPTYDWAHGLSDALEKVTHSVCTLEFSSHNELYDWFNQRVQILGNLNCPVLPRQYEFARLEMTHVVVSKRKLKRLVDGGFVEGWDDPRMPTISGMRRRGYPPSAITKLCELIGVTKVPSSVIRHELLDSCVRDVLQHVKMKLLCVLRPLRVIVTNYEGDDVVIEVPPEDDALPMRRLPFGRELVIERDDFMEEPIKGFKRLVPGGKVKLRYAYVLTCEKVVHDEAGNLAELHCTYDPDSVGKRPPKKVGVIHWAHATASVPLRVRLYDRLFALPRPEEKDDFLDALNPASLETIETSRCEPCVSEICEAVLSANDGELQPIQAQFERSGYFIMDEAHSRASKQDGGPLVFNRTLPLNESWKPPAAAKPP